MAVEQPAATDPLNSPSHSTQHKIIAADASASVKSLIVSSGDNVGIGTEVPTGKLDVRGSFTNTLGIRTVTSQYGGGLWIQDYGDSAPEHVNGTGSFDKIGGTYENLFTKSAGDDFTQADADNGNWILLMGANIGATAEIKDFIDADNVVVDGMNWEGDLASQSFFIMKHPTFITGNGSKHEFSVNGDGEFEIASYDFTGKQMIEFENDVNADGADTLHIKHNANGKSNSDAIHLFYNTGNLQAGDEGQAIQISLNETDATGGEVDLILLETTDATAAVEKHAIHIGTGFDSALTVSGAASGNMDYAYEVLANHTVTDRLTEFTTPGNDVEIFDNDNDYILIGNDVAFEVLEVVLAVNSSKGIVPTFEYSTGDGTWDTLVVDDGTQAFTTSGLVDWSAPGGWAETSHADGASGAITQGYYIRIARTYTPTIPTLPTESFFKIYLEQAGETGMKIDGQGVIKLPYLAAAPSSPENGMIWMESDGLHLYYAGAEKLVAGV